MIEWGEWSITERDMRACAHCFCTCFFFFFPIVTIKSVYGMKVPDIRRYI